MIDQTTLDTIALDLTKLNSTKKRFETITSPESKIIDEINDSLLWGAIKYFRKNNFVWVEVPTLTKITGACENVDTLYALNHFGQEAYLAQTGQLYLEAKIPLHEKIWTTITSSRAETAVDNRHLNQFTLIEMEHQGDFETMLPHIEGAIKSMLSETLDKRAEALQQINRAQEIYDWIHNPFSRITYTQGIELLQAERFQDNRNKNNNLKWGDDLTSTEEAQLVALTGNKPLFITHFPREIKFFNMKVNDQDESVVNSTDLIMPYSGESVGAAERENNVEKLTQRLLESKMYSILAQRGKTVEDFRDYLDMIQKNPLLHSGCGIGFNRISQSVLGVDDIRISTNYPLQSDKLY